MIKELEFDYRYKLPRLQKEVKHSTDDIFNLTNVGQKSEYELASQKMTLPKSDAIIQRNFILKKKLSELKKTKEILVMYDLVKRLDA